LAWVAGVSLVVGGLAKILASIAGIADERLLPALSGITNGIFGVLALIWPDVTVLVLAIVFGVRTMLFGFAQIGLGLSRLRGSQPTDGPPGRRRPYWLRLSGTLAALVAAFGLAGVSAWIHDNELWPDSFYDTPGSVPAEPGMLL